MASYHLHAQIIGRSQGRSAVAAAAYRHRARMEIEREARVVDYSNKKDLAHSEFTLPDVTPAWLRTLIDGRDAAGASAAFWNAVETFEKRSDAQFMREMDLALPLELTREQNIELVRDFIAEQITSHGMVADWAYHMVAGNPHVHVMTTLRPLTDSGFGPKRVPVMGADGKPLRVVSKAFPKGKIVYRLWAGDETTLRQWREAWAALQNLHLARNGYDIRVDHRSFADQDVNLEPTIKIGVAAKHIAGKEWAAELDRLRLFEEGRAMSAQRILARPALVLEMVSRERSVFDERDLAKIIHRYIDDPASFANVMAALLSSPDVVQLQGEHFDLASGTRVKARLATRDMIKTEAQMIERAEWLAADDQFPISAKVQNAVFSQHAWLHEEQKAAIEHITQAERIAAVVGLAGAGKTTALKAANEIWQRSGYRVLGAALAGKAAEGLEQEAGIASRTLASWELAWSQACNMLDAKTVLVLDEAGMVASNQMAHLVAEVAHAGAKLVLVGDGEQLQPIEAGAAFRSIHDRVGYAVLENIRRQKSEWMRTASVDLARGRIAQALDAYSAHGLVLESATKHEAMRQLISDWARDYNPNQSSLILAHLRRDVRLLNEMARTALIERDLIGPGHRFDTEDGVRNFAPGEQIVFLRNESSLGVKNGMIGHIAEAEPGRIVVEIGDDRRRVEVGQAFYRNVDHGYATTVHKSQGATVDRVKVLASLSLDKHLTYVALTRHRQDVALYFGGRSFAKAGGLVALLSRRNAKETTLDYIGSSDYRAALRFATTRGLHAIRVAQSLLAQHSKTIKAAKAKLADLGARLTALAVSLVPALAPGPRSGDLVQSDKAKPLLHIGGTNRPGADVMNAVSEGLWTAPAVDTSAAPVLLPGITAWPTSIAESVTEKLVGDEALRLQWRDVSETFARIYRDPQAAANAMTIDKVIYAPADQRAILDQLSARPSHFGELNGREGIFASKAERQYRRLAHEGGAQLRLQIERYAAAKSRTSSLLEAAEVAARQRASIDIPALSPAASAVMERIRDAVDRNDLPAALGFALADRMVKAEIDRMAEAVAQRFGERALLGTEAASIQGRTFKSITNGLSPTQRMQLAEAWPVLRAVQQIAMHEQKVLALKQTDTARAMQCPSLRPGQ